MSAPRLLARPTPAQVDALRAALDRARRLAHYRTDGARAGVDGHLIDADPLAALARLPVFDPATMARHAEAALALTGAAHELAGIELSSGTSGGPAKRRVLSAADVVDDAALLPRLLHHAGVRASDRVAAVEWTAQPLSAAFLEGCERLGVVDAAALSIVTEADQAALRRYDPSVLLAPPRLLRTLLPALTRPGEHAALRLVIYNGDRLAPAAVAALQARAVGVRSLYGLTETSALGVSCAAGAGVHLDPTRALAEWRAVTGDRRGGRELVVTTLAATWPLVRYPTGDRVRLVRGRCPCGLDWPRVLIMGRLGDRFALFDLEFSVDELTDLLALDPDASQVILADGPAGSDTLTIRQLTSERERQAWLRRQLRRYPHLDYLLRAGHVRPRFRYVEQFRPDRKLPRLIDRRGRAPHPAGGDGR